MIPAPKLEDIWKHSTKHPNAVCCILLAPPFTRVGAEVLIPRLAYLDESTGSDIHFYCVGYAGYSQEGEDPEIQPVATMTYDDRSQIPWFFYQREYSRLLRELQKTIKWGWKGEGQVIVLNSRVNFSDSLVLDIGAMVEDEAVTHPAEVFEELIRFSRSPQKEKTISEFSNEHAPNLFGNAVLSGLLEGRKGLLKTWKAGRHYAVRNLYKDIT